MKQKGKEIRELTEEQLVEKINMLKTSSQAVVDAKDFPVLDYIHLYHQLNKTIGKKYVPEDCENFIEQFLKEHEQTVKQTMVKVNPGNDREDAEAYLLVSEFYLRNSDNHEHWENAFNRYEDILRNIKLR